MDERKTPTLRVATLDDCHGASELLRGLGLGVPEDAAGQRRAWDWFWKDNPALTLDRPRPPLGWVLETEGKIVGFFGTIPLRYRFGERTLLVADASQWGVEKPHRGRTADLAAAYFAQREVDLFLVTTGIRATGRIFDRFGALPMPVWDYDRVLFWVLDAHRFLAAALHKKAFDPRLRRAAALGLSPILGAVSALPFRRPGRHHPGLEPELVPLSSVGDEFDDLWQRKVAEGRRLLAYRSAADIRWHFGLTADPDRFHLLRCRRAGRLAGYVVLSREPLPELGGMVRARIVDLLAAGDDPDVVDALLAAAADHARAQGAHMLELVGFPPAVRARAQKSLPFARSFPTSPFHYKAATPELGAELLPPRVWYPTLFDGDSSF